LLATGQLWVLPLVAADYAARAFAGPRFSPLARIAKAVAPRFGLRPHQAAGSPKRFAATMMIAA
jgi:hypothetical protein